MDGPGARAVFGSRLYLWLELEPGRCIFPRPNIVEDDISYIDCSGNVNIPYIKLGGVEIETLQEHVRAARFASVGAEGWLRIGVSLPTIGRLEIAWRTPAYADTTSAIKATRACRYRVSK